MRETWLLLGLAAVLAGIAALEFVLGFVYSPALFAVALPFAAAAYLVWYHASGRLRDRVERGRAGSYRRPDADTGGFGAGPRESFSGRRRGVGGRDARGKTRARPRTDAGPTAPEAYRTLGLEPGADAEAVRRAYRERVKAVHPDREGGDEDEFKRVKEAYERLRERD